MAAFVSRLVAPAWHATIEGVLDLLIKLYDLPEPSDRPALPEGITLRRALAPEVTIVTEWVRTHFGQPWADEVGIAFGRQPSALWVAVAKAKPVGFCAYDAVARGLLGPIGVHEAWRGRGLGRRLLEAALRDMRSQGYAYAVVGWAGAPEFFGKVAGAEPIAGSRPGLYAGMLQ
jgi:predicted N-acetyltransferase YhbS